MELNISNNFSLDPNKIVTSRTAIIGQSGSGKSYAIAVICEELLKNKIGFCIVDTEGEYFSLKEKFNILWIGEDEKSDYKFEDVDLKDLGIKAAKYKIPIIFDISEVNDGKEKLSEFLNSLYEEETKLKNSYLVILEEADKFIPQRGERIEIVDEIARRGRKRGIGLMISTQRPSIIDKDILSQCNNQIIGRLNIENDIKAVSIFFDDKEKLKELTELKPGEFFILGEIGNEKIKFRKRITTHKATTPKVTSWNFDEFKREVKKPTVTAVNPKIKDVKFIPIYRYKIKWIRKSLFGDEIKEGIIYIYENKIVKLKSLRTVFNGKLIEDLNEDEIKVLFDLKDIKKINYFSKEKLRKILKSLEKKGFVSSNKIGRRIEYYPMIKLNMGFKDFIDRDIKTIQMNLKENKIEEPKWVEKLIKALSKSTIVSKDIIYYPIKVEEKKVFWKKVLVTIDGTTGKKISL